MAGYAPAFREVLPLPPEEPLPVVTGDGRGVPMRRPLQDGPRAHHRQTEEANKKQRACVGTVYTIEPFVRRTCPGRVLGLM